MLDSIHAARPIAVSGMGVIFDTSPALAGEACFPEEIECRRCRRVYGKWGGVDVEAKEVVDVR